MLARIALLVAAPLFASSAFFTARLAYADFLLKRDTAADVERALVLDPRSAEAQGRLAELEPERAKEHWETALSLNPYFAKAWGALGIDAEIRGDHAHAEEFLLRAASLDRMFMPAWTLANFYFRRNQPEKFWPWAHRSTEMSYADLRPLFRLALEFTHDPAKIADRIVEAPNARRDFLNFLTGEGLLTDAIPVAKRVSAAATAEDRFVLLYYCDTQLAAGDVGSAMAAWNQLAGRGLIPYSAVSPESPLTNPAFREPLPAMAHTAFDWRFLQPEGVSIVAAAPVLRIAFSGQQAENAELAWQFVPLATGRKYRLTAEYRTADMGAASNVRFALARQSGAPVAAAPYFAVKPDWTRFEWQFETPAQPGAFRLMLLENRESGTARPRGTFYLQSLSLGPA